MDNRLDCIGMACPLPVIKAKKAIDSFKGNGTLYVKVDNETAVQNLIRLGEHYGFNVTSTKSGEKEFVVAIQVKIETTTGTSIPENENNDRVSITGGKVVVLSSNTMGIGDEKLGKKLMKAFIFALNNQKELPDKILCYNTGAYLTTEDSDTIKDLKALEDAGTCVMTCGTCLDYYGLKEKLQVGIISNMYDIAEAQMSASMIIKP